MANNNVDILIRKKALDRISILNKRKRDIENQLNQDNLTIEEINNLRIELKDIEKSLKVQNELAYGQD